jgi:minor extracellular serine protease Vpr
MLLKSSKSTAVALVLRRLIHGAAIFAVSAGAAQAGVAANVVAGGARAFNAVNVPLGISNKPVSFVLEMAGEPIAVLGSKMPNGMDAGAKASLRAQMRAKQDVVAAKVRALGGKVLSSYQLVYNGVRVVMPAKSQNLLAAIPGVIAVHRLQVFQQNNVHGVPLSGGPAVWGGVPGLRGEGIKIADIDTGIDYTHADFGGPGTVQAYNDALATDTAPPDPALVGPGAPKVKGGTDLVGDDYNADPNSPDYQPIPHPDANPLDCAGHGTHTAGTMAGFGVLSNGHTYIGNYGTQTVQAHQWIVGPGMAPKADLYAVRVFGCAGSTDVVSDAIEWSVDNGMDVINMSLGSPFGGTDDPSATPTWSARRRPRRARSASPRATRRRASPRR